MIAEIVAFIKLIAFNFITTIHLIMREEIHFDESFFIKVYCQDQCDEFYSGIQDDNFSHFINR